MVIAQEVEGVSLLQTLVTLLLAGGGIALLKVLEWALEVYKARSAVTSQARKEQAEVSERQRRDLVAELAAGKLDLEKRIKECQESLRDEVSARVRAEKHALTWRIAAEEQEACLPDVGIMRTYNLGFVLADEAGRILETTPGVVIITHFETAELVGKNVLKLVPPEDRPRFQAAWKKVLATGIPPVYANSVDAYVWSKEEAKVPVSVRGGAWPLGNGKWRFYAKLTERENGGGPSPGGSGELQTVTIEAPPGSVVEAKVKTDGASEKASPEPPAREVE